VTIRPERTSRRRAGTRGTRRAVQAAAVAALLCASAPGAGQTLSGTTGLITIPTAYLTEDGGVLVGWSAGHRRYNVQEPGFHEYSYYATLGFLPFLEVSLRLHRNYQFEWTDEESGMTGLTTQGIGDRMASFRVRLAKEGKKTPAVAVGVHDFLSAFGKSEEVTFYNALYAVASKTVNPAALPFRVGLHAGYGTDWIRAKHHDFNGWFGGVAVDAGSWLTVMTEYDSEKFNGGVSIRFLRHFRILLARRHFDTWAGGLSGSFRLRP
jgi:hypothetical protein